MASPPPPPPLPASPWPGSNPCIKPWAAGDVDVDADVDDDDDLRGISGSIKYNAGSEMETPP